MKSVEIIAVKRNEEGFWLILCPDGEEGKEVPDYHCVGSFTRGKPTCKHMMVAAIGAYEAVIQCLWPEVRKEE